MRCTPTVSVIIPCYNASSFIRETLSSVLAQSHQPNEVLVVDDGSTDDSAEIAGAYGSPVRVISQPNQGESVARNRGIEEARSNWIAFLDADDLWHPDKLARQLQIADDDVVCVHTNLYYFGDSDGYTRIQDLDESQRYLPEKLALKNCFHCPSSMIVRREQSPRFPEWTTHAEDLIYCLDVVRRGRVKLVEEPLTGYRRHTSAQTRNVQTQIGWHQTIRQWMRSNDWLAPEAVQSIDERWLHILVRLGKTLQYQRRWDEYWFVRRYLAEVGTSDVEVCNFLQTRIFPSALYRIKDAWVSLSQRINRD